MPPSSRPSLVTPPPARPQLSACLWRSPCKVSPSSPSARPRTLNSPSASSRRLSASPSAATRPCRRAVAASAPATASALPCRSTSRSGRSTGPTRLREPSSRPAVPGNRSSGSANASCRRPFQASAKSPASCSRFSPQASARPGLLARGRRRCPSTASESTPSSRSGRSRSWPVSATSSTCSSRRGPCNAPRPLTVPENWPDHSGSHQPVAKPASDSAPCQRRPWRKSSSPPACNSPASP